jgi:hypothetical protein
VFRFGRRSDVEFGECIHRLIAVIFFDQECAVGAAKDLLPPKAIGHDEEYVFFDGVAGCLNGLRGSCRAGADNDSADRLDDCLKDIQVVPFPTPNDADGDASRLVYPL